MTGELSVCRLFQAMYSHSYVQTHLVCMMYTMLDHRIRFVCSDNTVVLLHFGELHHCPVLPGWLSLLHSHCSGCDL